MLPEEKNVGTIFEGSDSSELSQGHFGAEKTSISEHFHFFRSSDFVRFLEISSGKKNIF
jgi:hypothetical protein